VGFGEAPHRFGEKSLLVCEIEIHSLPKTKLSYISPAL
jgi:hypothetical protein